MTDAPRQTTQPDDDPLVSVFKTDDSGLLPLATMALDAEGIEHVVRNAGKFDTLQWTLSQKPTSRPIVVEIVVAKADAARARDLLADLDRLSEMPATAPAMPPAAAEPPSIRLEDAATGIALGAISEAQLQELTSHLEEDAPGQYFVTPATIELLEEKKADRDLVRLLRQAVGSGDGLTVRWKV
jgi:hypothetical protein